METLYNRWYLVVQIAILAICVGWILRLIYGEFKLSIILGSLYCVLILYMAGYSSYEKIIVPISLVCIGVSAYRGKESKTTIGLVMALYMGLYMFMRWLIGFDIIYG